MPEELRLGRSALRPAQGDSCSADTSLLRPNPPGAFSAGGRLTGTALGEALRGHGLSRMSECETTLRAELLTQKRPFLSPSAGNLGKGVNLPQGPCANSGQRGAPHGEPRLRAFPQEPQTPAEAGRRAVGALQRTRTRVCF